MSHARLAVSEITGTENVLTVSVITEIASVLAVSVTAGKPSTLAASVITNQNSKHTFHLVHRDAQTMEYDVFKHEQFWTITKNNDKDDDRGTDKNTAKDKRQTERERELADDYEIMVMLSRT